jgi:putative DNA primase/helicase
MRMDYSADSCSVGLQTLRAVLGGDISGGQLLCPGPGHSPRDRSLAVKPATRGFLIHSFAGDDWRQCRDYVRERLGLPPRQRWRDVTPTKAVHKNGVDRNGEHARSIWSGGQTPRGTVAEDYLAARRLHLPPELCGSVLRFHPQCPWRSDDKVEFLPCLIAAFTSIDTNEITAIHRIRVDRPARWPKTERRMLGAVAGSAIKLDPVGPRLAIAEGVESALAARQIGFGATWATGSAREFEPIDGVNELVIIGERDDASRKAVDACSALWRERGRDVVLALPMAGNDFNDYLMMGAG